MQSGKVERLLASRNIRGFDRSVLLEVSKIRRGTTKNYKEIAKLAGRPRAYRAVGNALNRNPFPIKIPCHRVIKSDGTLGGYKYGTAKKRKLLAGEGVKI